jgi:hypothetical protein
MQPLLRRTPPFVLIGLMTLVVSLTGIADTGEQRPRPFPDLIPLPADFGSEGIAVGRGHRFYVGSFTAPMLGQILVGDLRTGTLEELVPPTGMAAVGMKVDRRTNFLYVAGGMSGGATVYDAHSGAEIAFFQFLPAGVPGIINDVVVTREAAYFTISTGPSLGRVAIGPGGQPSDASLIPLPANFGVRGVCGGTRANGIAATPNGKHLIVVHTSEGRLYLVETATFTVVPIEVTGGDFAGGGALCGGDGLLLDGMTLYVVQAPLNRIAVVELSPDHLSGFVSRYITEPFASNPATKFPTTIAEFGNSLYAVTYGGAPPSPDFVVRLPK